MALDVVRVGLPEGVGAGRDQNGYAACSHDRAHVTRIVGVGRQHLVAGFQDRLKDGRCGLGAAVGHENLPWLYANAVFLGQLAREGFPQLRQAVEDVMGLTRAQGLHRRLNDHGRGRNVGVAGIETDDVAPASCQLLKAVALRISRVSVEEVPDVTGDEPVAQVHRRRCRSTTRTRLSAEFPFCSALRSPSSAPSSFRMAHGRGRGRSGCLVPGHRRFISSRNSCMHSTRPSRKL